MKLRLLACVIVAAMFAAVGARAQLRGHGGPGGALAGSADGKIAISRSFDSSPVRWWLGGNAAGEVRRLRDSAGDAVGCLGDGRMATSGEDARIALWRPGEPQPMAVLAGHTAPVVALAVSRDGTMLASASWDRTARLWPVAGGAPRVLDGHTQNVN